MPVTTTRRKRNDTWPDVVSILKDADGNAVDLDGATVKFITKGSDGQVKTNAAATPDPDQAANKGRVTYSLTAADTDASDEYVQEWEVTFAGGQVGTFPNPGYNLFIVVDDLA